MWLLAFVDSCVSVVERPCWSSKKAVSSHRLRQRDFKRPTAKTAVGGSKVATRFVVFQCCHDFVDASIEFCDRFSSDRSPLPTHSQIGHRPPPSPCGCCSCCCCCCCCCCSLEPLLPQEEVPLLLLRLLLHRLLPLLRAWDRSSSVVSTRRREPTRRRRRPPRPSPCSHPPLLGNPRPPRSPSSASRTWP